MAHYAKVENGIVTQVIVADEEVIKTYPGTWIQTSYNTRNGVHYDPITGQPDGGVALRGTYACIGYTYDSERDIFIAPSITENSNAT